MVPALNASLSNNDASPLAKSSFKRLRVCLSSPSVDVSFTGGIGGVEELAPEAKLEAVNDEEAADDCNVNNRGGGGGRNSKG